LNKKQWFLSKFLIKTFIYNLNVKLKPKTVPFGFLIFGGVS
jgi:hypothetical protein